MSKFAREVTEQLLTDNWSPEHVEQIIDKIFQDEFIISPDSILGILEAAKRTTSLKGFPRQMSIAVGELEQELKKAGVEL